MVNFERGFGTKHKRGSRQNPRQDNKEFEAEADTRILGGQSEKDAGGGKNQRRAGVFNAKRRISWAQTENLSGTLGAEGGKKVAGAGEPFRLPRCVGRWAPGSNLFMETASGTVL